MGLLKRKQKQPIQQLQSKNPTGLPTIATPSDSSNVSNSSLIAAKAAAALSQHPADPTPPNKPAYNKPSSGTQSKPVQSTKPRRIMSTSRPMSMVISSNPSIRTPESHLHSGYNEFSDSLPDFPHLSISEQFDRQLPKVFSHPHSYTNSISNLSLQAASIATANRNTSNVLNLQPPAMINTPGFYSSGGSSPVSSVHSFESLPLAKPRSSNELFLSGIRSIDSIDKSTESLNNAPHDLKDGLFNLDDLNKSKESIVSDINSNVHSLRANYYGIGTKEDSLQNVSDKDDNLEAPNAYDSSYVSSRQPFEQFEPGNKTIKTFPNRKPPPPSPSDVSSPSLSATQSDFYDSPSQNLTNTRPSSPRRKPPPDHLISQQLDLTDSENVIDTEDELPKFYLDFNDLAKQKSHDYHKRHGLRNNAKKFLKKSLKSTSTVALGNTLSKKQDNLDKPVQLKSTLRKEKKKEKFNEDKPWKHHNDTEYITENERKRYEGVWVTNKGLYMNMVDPDTIKITSNEGISTALKASRLSTNTTLHNQLENDLILNIVVKELWIRSKLPMDQLRQIWDLVDSRRDGFLDKKSFIVGMWFVDQCLYGRKLPKFVSENVWNSVSNIGVNVVIKSKRKK